MVSQKNAGFPCNCKKQKGGGNADRDLKEAGKLAGYYSIGRDSDKLEIDYLQKKNVKKPAGSAPRICMYYMNSLTIHPDISGLTLVESSIHKFPA